MFSGNSWANPNAQQTPQQPQGGSTFGQPSGFGGSSEDPISFRAFSVSNTCLAFGSGGAFGNNQQQPQQPQQPQANPMFGNFGGGGNAPAPAATGFGATGGKSLDLEICAIVDQLIP